MNVFDLFSGIGGFSIGLERAGMKTKYFCEIDSFCKKVLFKNWPHVKIFNDINSVYGRLVNDIDVICGGFPCKQTSVAASVHGKRSGLCGKDSGLWFEYIRLVREIRPEWVIVENPPGVKKWENEIKGGLEDIGYGVSRLDIKASDFGFPHIRKRCFYVANANGKRLALARPFGSSKIAWSKRLAAAGGSWISSSPGIIGSFNGVPNRVDRVRSIGNSIVPDMAEFIGLEIMRHQ